MSQDQIDIINARFKTCTERLRFWMKLEPQADCKRYADLSGFKNERVVASVICKQGLRKH
ncbi:hypothetical protein KM031_02060 [Gemmobacter fulvus]|uniref:Uncharacterized protein n=1 Tax=Gemmobacter fulvus TaxID=2840474 RepID=A0A975P6V7_9RHOB|nr:hypothetical protein [Gemmobacter fulvus]MBT9244926.1 hypothetical protein [Gemmobacter fulvus]QWK90720.1 hypothetical protein KM031_02060 [Gemmobacter fulvus]